MSCVSSCLYVLWGSIITVWTTRIFKKQFCHQYKFLVLAPFFIFYFSLHQYCLKTAPPIFLPDPSSYFVGPLLAVCSISPRPVLQDSPVLAASAQTGPARPKSSADRDDQLSPQNQGTVGRVPKKQLSFVLENEKQQWWQTTGKWEQKECKPIQHVWPSKWIQ